DQTVTTTRTITTNSDANFVIDAFDTSVSDYANRSTIIVDPERMQLRYEEGDSSGSFNGYVEIDLDGSGITFTNTVTSAGIAYASDYSSNYTNRSLVDKAYADSVSLSQSDQVLTGARNLVGNSGTGSLHMEIYDLLSTTYTRRSDFDIHSTYVRMGHYSGDGSGSDEDSSFINFNATAITVN
ncbi:unnamed protein product, partial [marine sediment metagenome]